MIDSLKHVWHVLDWCISHTVAGGRKLIDYHVLLVIVLIAMTTCLFFVMFEINDADMTFKALLGTPGKKETIEFIAFGMGGVVAAIVATAISRRANAQMQNNELIEKGYDNERFQNMTANLGHDKVTVRIATFYQFCYLAAKNKGENPQKLREDIFEMLCSYLRAMPDNVSDLEEKDKNEYLKERQTLFDILFKDKFKSNDNGLMPDDFPADLQKINLVNIDLSQSNLSSVNLAGANLAKVYLFGANLVRTNLSWANLANANLMAANLTKANLSNADLAEAYLAVTNLADANFAETNLAKANLSSADLSRTDFSHTNLSGARLMHANLSDTCLWFANLSGAQLKSGALKHVRIINIANFCGVKIDNRPIEPKDLPDDKGKYYADWNPPPPEVKFKV